MSTKTEYSADSISRSYLEQQRAYYESAGLKGYPGYNGAAEQLNTKSYTPDSQMSGRQSTESPDIEKQTTPDPAAQAQALQAYYSQSQLMNQSSAAGQPSAGAASLPPLLPMAAQLSQYAASSSAASAAGYSQPSAGAGAADYSRRPLSVLF